MSGGLVVNGRFLGAETTGLQRTGRSLLRAVAARGLDLDVWAPPGTADPLVTRTVGVPGVGRVGGLLTEQIVLPAAAGRRPILSLTNTGPIAAAHGLVMVHDLAPLVNPAWFSRSMAVYARIVTAAARRAELVLTVSGTVAGELADLGIPRERIAVIRPAVDPAFRPASADRVRAVTTRLGLDRPFLVLTGWADPRKDALTAVRAHVRAAATHDHQLVLLGRPHPTFAAVELPPAPGLVHAGYLAEDDLVALLSGATAAVYPSHYEGFGLPPLEARSCGTPALVSDIPVLRESTGDDAIFVPPADVDAWATAIRTVLDDPPDVIPPPAWTWDDAAGHMLEATSSWL